MLGRKLATLAVGFLPLYGCATMFPGATTYVPLAVRVDSPAQFKADLAECHAKADPYSPGWSTSPVIQSVVDGATNNAAYAPINPIVPLAGAGGGLVSGLMGSYDLTGKTSIKILVHCIIRETERDHSALISDPSE